MRVEKEVQSTKDGDTRHFQITWTDGTISNKWVYKDRIMIRHPGIPEIQIFSRNGGLALDTLGTGDLPEFSWVQAGTYRGTENHNGKLCYLFEHLEKPQTRNFNIPLHPLASPPDDFPPYTKKAWVDVNTGFPVGLQDGLFIKVYTFSPDPPPPLQLPAEFDAALQKSLKAATDTPPPRPLPRP